MSKTTLIWGSLFIGMFLLGCGKNRRQMHLRSVSESNGTEKAAVLVGVNTFNSLLGENVVATDRAGYPVEIFVRSQESLNEISPSDSLNGIRHGYADASSDRCFISLSENLFAPGKSDILLSVIVHELGHCAGLGHNGTSGKIMSEYPAGFSTYSPETLAEFRADARSAIDNSDH